MKAILDILNKNGIHLPTVSEWERITEIVHHWQSPPRIDKWYLLFQLMQRFEEMTRGKMVDEIENGNVVGMFWQPAMLKKEMFVCEVKKPAHVIGETTVHDFIIECERSKADVVFTEYFCKQLIT